MNTLRIQGLVKFADRLRRELARSIAPERKAELRDETVRVLRQVDEILNAHGKRIESLPAPSRRAYEFLARLEWDAVITGAESLPTCAASPLPGSVRLAGLKSHWESFLQRLAQAPAGDDRDKLYESIHATSTDIERYLEQQRLRTEDLTSQTRMMRGWLAFFAQRERFEMYLAGAAQAKQAFEAALQGSSRFHPPVLVEFRPVTGFFRLRGDCNGTRVALPTPMICFNLEQFGQVARIALNGDRREPVIEASAGEEYQNIQAELEALDDVEENVAGVHRHLAASFERVNAAYFDGRLPRPRLTWNRIFTGRKFGHYDLLRNTVMISCSLDRAEVPEYVLDSVMYHELLHKQLGVERRNGRAAAHTPEFRAQERRFARFTDADNLLKKLAAGVLR